jgi:hypothetical protein
MIPVRINPRLRVADAVALAESRGFRLRLSRFTFQLAPIRAHRHVRR